MDMNLSNQLNSRLNSGKKSRNIITPLRSGMRTEASMFRSAKKPLKSRKYNSKAACTTQDVGYWLAYTKTHFASKKKSAPNFKLMARYQSKPYKRQISFSTSTRVETTKSNSNNITQCANYTGSGQKGPKDEVASSKSSLTNEIQSVYKKYLTKNQKKEVKPIPVPINEVSKTLSIDTVSYASPRNINRKPSGFINIQQNNKDATTTIGDLGTTSMNNVDEHSSSPKKSAAGKLAKRNINIQTKRKLDAKDLPKGILPAMHLYHSQTIKAPENDGDSSYFSSVRTSISEVNGEDSFYKNPPALGFAFNYVPKTQMNKEKEAPKCEDSLVEILADL